MENDNTNLQNQNYYSKKSNKVVDFLIGYLGFFVVIAILYYFIFFAGPFVALNSSAGLLWIIIIIIPVVALLVANVGLRKSRRYMARGINFAVITLFLIPVIFFGACLISIGR